MMGPKQLQGWMLAFVLLTLVSLTLEGLWLGSREESILYWLTQYETKNYTWFSFPLFFGGFFIHGLPAMLTWDYSFFHALGSAGSIMRLILSCVVSIGFVWAIAALMLPIIGNMISKVAGGLASLFRLG